MATKKLAKPIDTWKKKKWHRILAPRMFNEAVLGETPALEPDMLIGRTVSVNLASLTKDMKRQGTNVLFEVDNVKGDTAYSHIKKLEITYSSIRRQVRRGRNRIDDSFIIKTKDGKDVAIKPFFLTTTMANNSVNTAIRKKAKEFLKNYTVNLSYDALCSDIISNRLQKTMRSEINKIFPVRMCDIRVLEVMGKVEAAAEEAKPEEKPEAKEIKKPEHKKEAKAEEEKAEAEEKPKKEAKAKSKKSAEEAE